jgi:hypothetical protein
MTAGGNPGSDDAGHFTGSPTADDDADGFSNLAEYALGQFPLMGIVNTPEGLVIGVPRILNADDAEILCEVSTALTGWTAMELVASNDASLAFRVPAALATERRLFVRATVRLR